MTKNASSNKFNNNQLRPTGTLIRITGEVPGENLDKGELANITVLAKDSKHEKAIKLTKKIAEGGEGAVFDTSIKGFVAKVYFRNKITTDRRDKLQIMINNPISYKGICFPEALVLNTQGEFVGYLMRSAKGHELGKSIFQPKLFLAKFPEWTKVDSIDLCLTILEKIEYLNAHNVIIGDINPANILIVSPKEVYFVDCDSYQIEGYPCPVGTTNYTAPEAQGKDYKAFLRTQEMENFAIATLMFMIMLPGKPPYSAVGGASPEKNIENGIFPYPLTEDTNKTPPGKWGFIWSHLSYKTKEAFFQTFKRGEKHFKPTDRYDATEWIAVFNAYRHSIDKMAENDPMAKDIFPTRKKGENVVERRRCKTCQSIFPITRNQINWEKRKSTQAGNPAKIEVCDSCKAANNKPHPSNDPYRLPTNSPHQKPQSITPPHAATPQPNIPTHPAAQKATPNKAQRLSKIQGYSDNGNNSPQTSQSNSGKHNQGCFEDFSGLVLMVILMLLFVVLVARGISGP